MWPNQFELVKILRAKNALSFRNFKQYSFHSKPKPKPNKNKTIQISIDEASDTWLLFLPLYNVIFRVLKDIQYSFRHHSAAIHQHRHSIIFGRKLNEICNEMFQRRKKKNYSFRNIAVPGKNKFSSFQHLRTRFKLYVRTLKNGFYGSLVFFFTQFHASTEWMNWRDREDYRNVEVCVCVCGSLMG